ncbi:alpha/beta fold hydrolase [Oceanospirillum sediminis]|uniref:Alpha/beta hydrolase n=1 Tax=Oceanospirillum sediminis TaxID=2760088 RepID=A0A839IW94_9GAMM|nr:alpha/beta hydrolase [Oceanospirillum sediminis]
MLRTSSENELKILIQGEGKDKPVILWLHGGPGHAITGSIVRLSPELLDHFIIVDWDQPGAGLAYSDQQADDGLYLEQLVEDAYELTLWLKSHFDQQKIYLLAHSFGTLPGLLLASRYPDDYHAYGAIAQITNIALNEQHRYDFALSAAITSHNGTAITALSDAGRPDEDGIYPADESGTDDYHAMTSYWVAWFGGAVYGETSDEAVWDFIRSGAAYQDNEQLWLDGKVFSRGIFYDDAVWAFDAFVDVPELKLPVIFYTGMHDHEVSGDLLEQYFSQLMAREKIFIPFDASAHYPFFEQPEHFAHQLISTLNYH